MKFFLVGRLEILHKDNTASPSNLLYQIAFISPPLNERGKWPIIIEPLFYRFLSLLECISRKHAAPLMSALHGSSWLHRRRSRVEAFRFRRL